MHVWGEKKKIWAQKRNFIAFFIYSSTKKKRKDIWPESVNKGGVEKQINK